MLERFQGDLNTISLALGIIATVWAYFSRSLIGKGCRAVAYRFSAISRLETRLDEVMAQLLPNGGGSMRDAINRIESRLTAVMDEDSSAMFEADASGLCIYANPSMLRLTQRTMDQLKGNGWYNIVDPMDRESVRAEWTAAIEEKRSFEAVFFLVGGREVSVNSREMVDRAGNIVGHLVFVRNI